MAPGENVPGNHKIGDDMMMFFSFVLRLSFVVTLHRPLGIEDVCLLSRVLPLPPPPRRLYLRFPREFWASASGIIAGGFFLYYFVLACLVPI